MYKNNKRSQGVSRRKVTTQVRTPIDFDFFTPDAQIDIVKQEKYSRYNCG